METFIVASLWQLISRSSFCRQFQWDSNKGNTHALIVKLMLYIPIKRIINDKTIIVPARLRLSNDAKLAHTRMHTTAHHIAIRHFSGRVYLLPHCNQSSEPMNLEVTAEWLNEWMNDESVLLQFSINSTRSDTCVCMCVCSLYAEAAKHCFSYSI